MDSKNATVIFLLIGFIVLVCTKPHQHDSYVRCLGVCEGLFEQCAQLVDKLQETYFVCIVQRSYCAKNCDNFKSEKRSIRLK